MFAKNGEKEVFRKFSLDNKKVYVIIKPVPEIGRFDFRV